MGAAYRDDLEAARLRAADLERELVEVRKRNQTLEAAVAAREVSEYRNKPVVLEATRRGRLLFSLVAGGLGATMAGSAFADHMIGVGVTVTIIFGGILAFVLGVRRVDPQPRSEGQE